MESTERNRTTSDSELSLAPLLDFHSHGARETAAKRSWLSSGELLHKKAGEFTASDEPWEHQPESIATKRFEALIIELKK